MPARSRPRPVVSSGSPRLARSCSSCRTSIRLPLPDPVPPADGRLPGTPLDTAWRRRSLQANGLYCTLIHGGFMLTRFAPLGVRAAVVATFAACSLAVSSHAFAQQPTPSPGTPAVQAAAGKEEGGFFKSLVVNLGDDVKHMPRMNSLYWLAAGSGLAL